MIYYEIEELLDEWIRLTNSARTILSDCIPLSFMDYVKLRTSECEVRFVDDKQEWYRIRQHRKKKNKIDEKKEEIENIFKEE